ncbi:hypothetical protein [Anaeromyxobacter sp. Fw109-5]|uniref:hypothetical protein n=1 Tax=Anaeromyxobacter sp. (strain Fw109-5) TaxID=404589 RepID=UPI00059CBD49|nr:hypothetical protein [Anaeromyxobacter sp. Fw109-5]
MKERNGVRVGQRVRSVDGKSVGRVVELFDEGFAVQRGFPILFRKDFVFRYDEVRGTRDGALVVARGERDLFQLARGELPASWRIPAPSGFPTAAAPAEARAVFAEVASARLPAPQPTSNPSPGPAPAESLIWERPAGEPATSEERRYAQQRGQSTQAPATHH